MFLEPGQIIFNESNTPIAFMVDTGLIITIFDFQKKLGGILYTPNLQNKANSKEGCDHAGIETSIVELLSRFKRSGSNRESLEVKLIGGAFLQEENSSYSQQSQIVLTVVSIFREYGIPIKAKSVGGNYPKKGRFFTATGKVEFALVESADSQKESSSFTNRTDEIGSSQKIKHPSDKISVFIIDDSPTCVSVLRSIIESDNRFRIIGTANNPVQGLEAVRKLKPDVITLDLYMPEMDGLTFLKNLYPDAPIPVIVVSSIDVDSSSFETIKALELGAFDFLKKPTISTRDKLGARLCETIVEAQTSDIRKLLIKKKMSRITVSEMSSNQKAIVIGSSTGGTVALTDILTQLPERIPPIIIVQHMPPVFSKAFAERLNAICPFRVKEAENGDNIVPSSVYIAPGGFQMEIKNSGNKNIIRILDTPPVNRHKPSCDVLFSSAAKVLGKNAIGAILTGMGRDGANGIKLMHDVGAYTIAQDEKSSVVFGMPKAAIEEGGIDEICHLDDIPRKLVDLLRIRKSA